MKHWIVRFLSLAAAAVAVTGGTSAVNAALLTTVPMQGGMVMPLVSYQAVDGRMHVVLPPEVPQLTPLLVSHPGDSFDPADPWFHPLDPAREGASFSRRCGFVMDAMSDPLPPGAQMWIRKVSGPGELKFYRYSSSLPKTFAPIFGTAEATNALHWNGMMFHPVVAAPPGTNSYSAIFEVVLLDSATGQQIPDSSSGPFVLHWTNLQDGRPELRLARTMVIDWPAGTATNWVLEGASAVNASTWTTITNPPVTLNGRPGVIVGDSSAQQYFRMRYVP